ncbi:MAG TPA: RNA 3'-terminal phosphate cyclase [Tepidisphaeraceae bacterium]|nr:RNA 3'-terminal phosphate cyclase [Tepidisphaeraceae bacterium]
MVRQQLGWPDESLQIRQLHEGQGPGNVVTIEIGSEHVTEVFTGFGQRGVRAEAVAADAVGQAKKYLADQVPIGEHLADQLLLPFAMAGGGAFVTCALTRHSTTNIDVIGRFLEVAVDVREVEKGKWKVEFGRG